MTVDNKSSGREEAQGIIILTLLLLLFQPIPKAFFIKEYTLWMLSICCIRPCYSLLPSVVSDSWQLQQSTQLIQLSRTCDVKFLLHSIHIWQKIFCYDILSKSQISNNHESVSLCCDTTAN